MNKESKAIKNSAYALTYLYFKILMADDKELNKWCSLKRALQYKPEHVEMQEIQSYKQKATNEMFKQKILKSLYT